MNLRDKLKFWILLSNYVDMIVRGTSPLSLPDAIANSLSYVKAFGGTEQRDIPDNYLQRQFIYMMDDSYLVPDITPEPDWHIEMDFQTTSVSTSSVRDYFGGRYDSSAAGAGIRLGHTTSKKVIMYGFDTNNAYTGSANIADNTRYKYVYNNNSATLSTGGTVVDSTTFTPNDTTTSAVGINAYRGPSGSYSSASEGIYLYSFKAWNGQGELVMNLVPAVQKGTVPVVGFYDTVSKTFKTATAGTFAAGGEAVPTPDAPMDIVSNNGVLKARHQSGLPLGYTLLDYVSFDGVSSSGAYVDTGIEFYNQIPNNKIRIKAKAKVYNKSSWQVICGNLGSVSAYIGVNPENKIACGFGSNDAITDVLNQEVLCVFDLDLVSGTYKVTNTSTGVDIVNITGILPVASTAVRNILLGGYANSSGTITNNRTKMHFESAEIYNDGVLVSKLIPCKNSSNVVGVYDTVRNVFLTNIVGSTNLVAGSAVSDPVEIYTDGTVETINVRSQNLLKMPSGTVTASGITMVVADGKATFTGSFSSNYFYGKISGASLAAESSANAIQGQTYASEPVIMKAGQTYKIYALSQPRTFYCTCADGTRDSITGSVQGADGYLTYTPVKDITALWVQYFSSDGLVSGTQSVYQLTEGSTEIPYAPYYNGGTATAEMLLKIGGYQDVQSIIDGVVTRNVGVKVFDGTENWNIVSTNYADGTHRIYTSDFGYDADTNGISTHFVDAPLTDRDLPTGQQGKMYHSATSFHLRATQFTSLEVAKQWLTDQYAAGTPVIVIYPLATPTTETVTGQTLQVTDGDNVLEITQASLNGLELESKYKKQA